MTKVKKIISKIGELPISITTNGVRYYLNGIAYRCDRRDFSTSSSIDFAEMEEDANFLYLNFYETVIEEETEDTIVVNKKAYIQIKYSKKNKKMFVAEEGYTSGIDKFIKQIKRIRLNNSYSQQNIRNFIFSVLEKESFYESFIENFIINDFDDFYVSIIRLYLTDNICLLSFFSKFNLFESINQLLSVKDQGKILCKLKESQETIVYKFCELFSKYEIDYLESVLNAGNNLNNNEMILLYNFVETILKLNKILKNSSLYVRIPSIKDIIDIIVDIKILDINLTLALNTICKDIFKNYNVTDIKKVMVDYRDYLVMLKDINDTKTTKFPKNIIVEHDNMVKRYNIIQAEKQKQVDLEKALESQRKVVSFKNAVSEYKHLEYENDVYKIIIPENPSDLTNEGIDLHHCVGGYIDSVIRKSSQILFCRKQDNVCSSYMTIEVCENRIVQAKKYRDSYPDENDEMFLREFCRERHLEISGY